MHCCLTWLLYPIWQSLLTEEIRRICYLNSSFVFNVPVMHAHNLDYYIALFLIKNECCILLLHFFFFFVLVSVVLHRSPDRILFIKFKIMLSNILFDTSQIMPTKGYFFFIWKLKKIIKDCQYLKRKEVIFHVSL